MVSLRQRASKPSYTSMAGLENLSDGEGSDTAGPSNAPLNVEEGEQLNDSDSVSSGASSEFQLAVGDGTKGSKKVKGRGRVGAKGKGKAVAEQSDSAFEGDDADDTSDDASMDDDDDSIPDAADEMDDDDELVEVTPAPSTARARNKVLGGPRAKGGRKRATAGPSTPRSSLPAYAMASEAYSSSTNDPSLLPLAYRNVIQKSTEVLTKATGKRPQTLEKDYEKFKRFGSEGMSFGPVTPFSTRLSAGRREKQVGLRWVWENEDAETRKNARKAAAWMVEARAPLHQPWQMWAGEGYWRGMYQDEKQVTGNGKGKGREEIGRKQESTERGWVLREHVTLGLGGVGRSRPEELDVITSEQAKAYLPPHSNVVCHLGPHKSQTRHAFPPLTSRSLNETRPGKDGFVFSAGGPIWGMDWCPVPSDSPKQYLAVSTLRDINDQPSIGVKRDREDLSAIQIWSIESKEGGTMQCEAVLCVKGGAALDLKWMPLGARDEKEAGATTLPKLGILAAVQLDGTVSFHSVPRPDVVRQALPDIKPHVPLFLRTEAPLLRLDFPDAAATCLDWMTGSKVALGLSNGHGIVWDVLDGLKGNIAAGDLLPIAYFPLAVSPIRSVAAARHPTADIQGVARYDTDPTHIIFGSYDGTTTMIDLRDLETAVEVNRQRRPALCVAWIPQMAAAAYADVDGVIQMHKVFGGAKHRFNAVSVHRGVVWSIGVSDYHTMMASASADGSVIIASFLQGYHRKRAAPLFFHRVYEMDYDSHRGEFRMTDDFLPEVMSLLISSDRLLVKHQKTAEDNPTYIATAAWSPQVGAHKVTWNHAGGLRNAGWLASGTASGLGRVDWVEGKFTGHGPIPEL